MKEKDGGPCACKTLWEVIEKKRKDDKMERVRDLCRGGKEMENNQTLHLPIGFMDSGLGGLSVLREAVKLMPEEDFIYYGDSANAPYGTKSRDEIRALTFHVVEYLLERGIKGLAVACNTATSAAVRDLRKMYPDLPIVGIEPAVKPAVLNSKGGRILVMATPMTIELQKFHSLLEQYEDKADIVAIPCKGLMEFVENGDLEGEDLSEYFTQLLAPYLTENTEGIVLGCTHYPFLEKQLKAFLSGREIKLYDGSYGTAAELKRRIGEKGLLRNEERIGNIEILNSLNDPGKIALSYKLLQIK